jgi:hypothetical protein
MPSNSASIFRCTLLSIANSSQYRTAYANNALTCPNSGITFLCMPTPDSRIRKNLRQYHGQTDAESLVNWLNVTEDSVGRARIIDLRNALAKAMKLEAATGAKITKRKDGLNDVEMTPERKRAMAAKKDLNKVLAYYKVIPHMEIFSSGRKGYVSFGIYWTSSPGSKLARHSLATPKPGPGREWKKHYDLPGGQMGEIGALFNVFELIKLDLISKIDMCQCGKFFFRKFAHQRFCSQQCKLAEFRTNDVVREKRNEYARKLYHLHKTGKVK